MVTPYWEQPGQCHHPDMPTAPGRCPWCGEQSRWATVFSIRGAYIPPVPRPSIWQRLRDWMSATMRFGIRVTPYVPQDSDSLPAFVSWLIDLAASFTNQVASIKLRV